MQNDIFIYVCFSTDILESKNCAFPYICLGKYTNQRYYSQKKHIGRFKIQQIKYQRGNFFNSDLAEVISCVRGMDMFLSSFVEQSQIESELLPRHPEFGISNALLMQWHELVIFNYLVLPDRISSIYLETQHISL